PDGRAGEEPSARGVEGERVAGTEGTAPGPAPAAEARPTLPADTAGPPVVAPDAAHPPVTSPGPAPAPATAEVAEPVGAPEVSSGPSLWSHDPGERRRALEALAGSELSDEALEQVVGLALDPEPEVRRGSFQLLSQRAGALEEGLVRRALHDPADEVRAAVVRLAAMRGPQELRHLAPLIEARRWPQTQQQVLEVLPDLVAQASPLADEDLDTILA